MSEFKSRRISNSIVREYTEEDYERAKEEIKDKIDPYEVRGIDDGHQLIQVLNPANGVLKLTKIIDNSGKASGGYPTKCSIPFTVLSRIDIQS